LVLLLGVAWNSSAHGDLPRYLFGTPHIVEGINSPDTVDWAPALSADGGELFFGRSAVGDSYSDLYVSRRASPEDPWGEPQLVEELRTDFGDAQPSLSADGLTMYYIHDDPFASVYEVYSATRATRTSPFEAEQKLFGGPPGDPPVVAPSVSYDGLSLYVQRHETADDLADIYVSRRASVDQPWGELEPVEELSDPNKWQSRPHISADGRALFFYEGYSYEQSNRAARGGGDLLMLVRPDVNAPWSQPINLGSAINTNGSEDFAHLAGSTFYFNRRITDSDTTVDIWEAPVLPFSAVAISGSYSENFDSLSAGDTQAGTPLPEGWTFTANDVVFSNATTGSFPARQRNYAGVYNAGTTGETDRSLVTDYSLDEGGELQLRAQVTDDPLRALRLKFDVEAWQVFSSVGAGKGEAAFQVLLEADSGAGFVPVADLGTVTSGPTLDRPAAGSSVDGNSAVYRLTYDSGPLDVGDIPEDVTLRIRWISTDASQQKVVFGLDNVSLRFAAPGDANIDGVFNSTDLIEVLANGEYEDNIAGNSTWSEGDWTGEGDFDSGDLVEALASGGYVEAAIPVSVPEPTGAVLTLLGGLPLALRARHFKHRRDAP
jgi:hypothetical protein